MTNTFGIEIEISGASISAIKSALDAAEIRGCDVKPDGTPGVDAEIVLPPLAPCDFAWDYIKSICRVLESVGASVNSKCGLHVHIGNAPLIELPLPPISLSIISQAKKLISRAATSANPCCLEW